MKKGQAERDRQKRNFHNIADIAIWSIKNDELELT